MLLCNTYRHYLHFAITDSTLARPGGNPDLRMVRNTGTKTANSKRRKLADDYARATGEKLMEAIRQHGGMLHIEYAEWLNENGWPTRRGGHWTATQVGRVFRRLGLEEPAGRTRGERLRPRQ